VAAHPWRSRPRVGGVVKDTARYEYDPSSALSRPSSTRSAIASSNTYNLRTSASGFKLPGGITDTTTYDTDGVLVLNASEQSFSHEEPTTHLTQANDTVRSTRPRLADRGLGGCGTNDPDVLWPRYVIHSLRSAPVKNDEDTALARSDEQIQLDALGNAYSTSYTGTLASPSSG